MIDHRYIIDYLSITQTEPKRLPIWWAPFGMKTEFLRKEFRSLGRHYLLKENQKGSHYGGHLLERRQKSYGKEFRSLGKYSLLKENQKGSRYGGHLFEELHIFLLKSITSELKINKLCRWIENTKNEKKHDKKVIDTPAYPGRFWGNNISNTLTALHVMNNFHEDN